MPLNGLQTRTNKFSSIPVKNEFAQVQYLTWFLIEKKYNLLLQTANQNDKI